MLIRQSNSLQAVYAPAVQMPVQMLPDRKDDSEDTQDISVDTDEENIERSRGRQAVG